MMTGMDTTALPPTAPPTLRCDFTGIGKRYRTLRNRAGTRAVDDVTLTVSAGEIFGIVGPNGAGKSTLINLLLGFIRPTTGQVHIGGQTPRDFVERRGVSFLPELIAMPGSWTLAGALHRCAVLDGTPQPVRDARVEDAITLMGLAEHRDKRVKHLSKGNLQRLGIAQALMSDRELMVLDEPTHGLDPVWTANFRGIARSLRRPDRIVIVTSHNLDEMERIADRVAIIAQGRVQRIVSIGTPSDARDGTGAYRLVVRGDAARVAAAFPAAIPIPDGRAGEFRIPNVDVAALNTGLRTLLGDGVELISVVPERSQLESTFQEVVRRT